MPSKSIGEPPVPSDEVPGQGGQPRLLGERCGVRELNVEEQYPEFLLVDATGEARVLPGPDAEFETRTPRRESFGGLKSPNEAARVPMARANYKPQNFITMGIHRVTEHRFLAGDRAQVFGCSQTSEEPATVVSGPRVSAKRILLGRGSAPVKIQSSGP